MNEYQKELLDYALTILKKRAVDKNRNVSARAAYNSAISIVTYALEENKEYLSRFDC